jgi:hypothetical protein
MTMITAVPPRAAAIRQGLFLLLVSLILMRSYPPALHGAEEASGFGSFKPSANSLIGILYDLKQTQTRQPTAVSTEKYWDVLDAFLANSWDEAVLTRYFKAGRPLYTTQIYIPEMKADAAPNAFGVGDIVQPSRWMIHYKGQVSPPHPGTYRFVGYCDDIMVVGVNAKVVLVSGWPGHERISKVLRHTAWDATRRSGLKIFSGRLMKGDWITLKAGEIIDLDIIIGERPGGAFCAVLLIEEQGMTYEQLDNESVLLIFQPAPLPPRPSEKALVAPTTDIWQATR